MNLEDINKKINSVKEEIKLFDSNERKEIKKNNKILDEYILLFNKIRDNIKEEILSKYKDLIPDDKVDINENKLLDCLDRVKYLSSNSFINKMGIDKNLYEIRYSLSIDVINDNISLLLDKFLQVGINLKKEDFKYSISVYKYMSFYLDNNNKLEFDKLMKEMFDSLYWECFNLVNYIYLCFIYLLDKYKDKFLLYIKNKYSSSLGYDYELDNYYKLVIENNMIINKSEYNYYNKFLNGELRIEDYLDNSSIKKDIISKFVDYDKYMEMNREDRLYFYNQIRNVYYELCDYLMLDKYSYLIKKVREIYLNKNNYLNNYSSFLKSVKGLLKKKESLNKKLFYLYSKINDKSSKRLIGKYNKLFNQVNSKIDEISKSYDNYDEILVIDKIIRELNDESTYYDAFLVVVSNYGYINSYMKDKDGSYKELCDYLYSPYLSICKSIPFISDMDIESKLDTKYDLFDIEVDLSDKMKLKEDLEYIIRLSYIDEYNIDIDKFKLIFDIDKMFK